MVPRKDIVLKSKNRSIRLAQICRAASTLLTVLLQSPKGAERLNEEEFAGLSMIIDVLDRSVPQDAAAVPGGSRF